MGRDARRARLRPHCPADCGQLRNDCGRIADAAERRLSRAQRLHARSERWAQTPGDGVAARRRILERFRLRPHSRWHRPRAHARRRRRDHQSSAQCVRLHVSRRCDGIRFRAFEQRGPARHRRLARVGARQYRRLWRRPKSRDDLRSVGRRSKSRHVDVHAQCERAVSSGHYRERSRVAFDDARRRCALHGSSARRVGTEGGAGARASEPADDAVARGERGCAEEDHIARARRIRKLTDGGRQGDPRPSMGSEGARAIGERSPAHRLRAHRGDALRPADAREVGARRSRAA